MLFHSSLRKELSRSFGATLVVLITIVMTMMLIRTLGLASRGSVNPADVLLVMAYTVLGYLPVILSLSLFVSIVGTLSRLYRDSEMVIWFTSGRGLADFLTPLFRFAWPVLVLIGGLALVGWPWANSQTQGMRDQYQSRGDIDRITPGQFQESANHNRVFFIDKDTGQDNIASNVFISSIERNLQIITSARNGKIENVDGNRFLMLRDGQRLESPLDARSELKISEFQVYGARIGGAAAAAADETPSRNRSTLLLLAKPTDVAKGELAWRIGMLFAAINFVLLALTIAGGNPRAGRSGNLLVALFAFVIYYNLLNLGQSWIAAGRYSMSGFLVVLHGGMLALCLLWLLKRHHNWGLPRRRNTASPMPTPMP